MGLVSVLVKSRSPGFLSEVGALGLPCRFSPNLCFHGAQGGTASASQHSAVGSVGWGTWLTQSVLLDQQGAPNAVCVAQEGT